MLKFFNRLKSKRAKVTAFGITVVAVIGILVFSTAQPALAAVTINTSTNSSATPSSNQRKIFWDDVNSLYWAFYFNGTSMAYDNSSNGTTWTNRGTVSGADSSYASLWFEPGHSTVYIAYDNGNFTQVKQGTLGTTSITGWTTATQLTASSSQSSTSICMASDGRLWVTYLAGSSLFVAGTTNPRDTSAFTIGATLFAGGSQNKGRNATVVPMTTSGDVMAFYIHRETFTIEARRWTSATSTLAAAVTVETINNTTTATAESILAAVASPTDNVHLIYQNAAGSLSTGAVHYALYSGGSWGTPITLDSNTTNKFPTISTNTANNDLYAMWMRGGTIYYKKGVSPYAGGNWDVSATSMDTTSTNTGLTTAYQDGNSRMNIMWESGAGSPFNIQYDYIALNSPPNAPTLSSPASGALVASATPDLQMAATDPDSDTIKYKVLLYNTTAQSGGNCSGSSVETADQNSSGTGYDNGTTAYASGATATYTVQTTLTRGNDYCWQAQGNDPSGTNTFGSLSTPSTFTVNTSPAAPTLIIPAASATNISALPQFSLNTTDANDDYLQYKIVLYDSDCSSAPPPYGSVQTIDQSSSQTNWQNKDMQSNTAYSGDPTLANSTVARYQLTTTALTANHTFCWKAAAIDPGGSNAFGSFSSTQTFTTGTSEVQIQGGTTIQGGSVIQ